MILIQSQIYNPNSTEKTDKYVKAASFKLRVKSRNKETVTEDITIKADSSDSRSFLTKKYNLRVATIILYKNNSLKPVPRFH
jgi:hypothetical protein